MLSDAALPSGLLLRLALFLVMAKISDALSIIDEQNPNLRSPGTGEVHSLQFP